MRVLSVEDDRATSDSIALMLRSESYVCDTAELGEDGLEIAKLYDYDIILLDLMLPDMDGLEVLRRLRMAKIQTPVVILTGLAEMTPRIKGFGQGADDYLVKPVDKRELLARIQAIVRRTKGHCNSIIEIGRISINIHTRAVAVDGQPLHLTQKEYCILELLALRRGMVQTKEALMNHLYGGSEEPGFKIVDVFLCKLRKKLLAVCGESYIETQWGRGYVLRVPEATRDASQPQAA
jgi:two-component system cell cycle response regulator CtrA